MIGEEKSKLTNSICEAIGCQARNKPSSIELNKAVSQINC